MSEAAHNVRPSAAHAVGAAVLVDAAQALRHRRIDVRALGCDFLVFSGHKLCAPGGIGVLYAARDRLALLRPVRFGGSVEKEAMRDTVEAFLK